MPIEKTIKDYSNRLRINIVASDGLNAGDEVVILPYKEYQTIINDIADYKEQVRKCGQDYKTLESRYRHDVASKEKEISQLENIIMDIYKAFTTFIINISSVSWYNILFHKEHIKIINDFKDTIFIKVSTDPNLETGIKSINDADGNGDNDGQEQGN